MLIQMDLFLVGKCEIFRQKKERSHSIPFTFSSIHLLLLSLFFYECECARARACVWFVRVCVCACVCVGSTSRQVITDVYPQHLNTIDWVHAWCSESEAVPGCLCFHLSPLFSPRTPPFHPPASLWIKSGVFSPESSCRNITITNPSQQWMNFCAPATHISISRLNRVEKITVCARLWRLKEIKYIQNTIRVILQSCNISPPKAACSYLLKITILREDNKHQPVSTLGHCILSTRTAIYGNRVLRSGGWFLEMGVCASTGCKWESLVKVVLDVSTHTNTGRHAGKSIKTQDKCYLKCLESAAEYLSSAPSWGHIRTRDLTCNLVRDHSGVGQLWAE